MTKTKSLFTTVQTKSLAAFAAAGCPTLDDKPEFKPEPSLTFHTKPVTWINGIEYTKAEYKLLADGADLASQLAATVQAVDASHGHKAMAALLRFLLPSAQD